MLCSYEAAGYVSINKVNSWDGREEFFTFTRCCSNLCGLFLFNVLIECVTLPSGANCTFGKMPFGLLYDDTLMPEHIGTYR